MSRLIFLLFFISYKCVARESSAVISIPNQGDIMGKEISMIRTHRIMAYLGIPYAQPPIGNLRFAPPQINPLPAWDGIRNATEYAPACLQTDRDYKKQDLPFLHLISDLSFEVNEDCLYLNIFVPFGDPPTEGYATIVWIHPGNFTTGSPTMWNPYTIVYRQEVIVVTVAWRLNIMGFFTSMDGEAPGNFGLMDQQAALMWIKDNIKLFNGNPDNICLMGYGTGAMSVGLHMINLQSYGLFSKAIAMSANFFNPSAVRYPKEDETVLDDLADFYGCFRKPVSAFMECLRRVDGDRLVKYTSNINWRPLIDLGLSNSSPPFLPDLPRNYFERGEFYKVPFLTGYTNMEDILTIQDLIPEQYPENATDEFLFSLLSEIVNWDLPTMNDTDICFHNFNHIIDSVMFFYGPVIPITDIDEIRKLIIDFATEKSFGSSSILYANFISKYEETYMYRFDMKPSTSTAITNIPEWASVPHLFDLIYVWGIPYWTQLPKQFTWDARDKRTSDIIMLFWTNFAKYSNPTKNSLYAIKWDQFEKSSPKILIIDRAFNMSDTKSLNYKSFEFWNEYYPKVLEISTQCCNVTDTSNSTLHFNYNLILFVILYNMIILYIFL